MEICMRAALTIGVLAAAVALAGCASDPADAGAAATPPSTATTDATPSEATTQATPSPAKSTPTAMPMDEAAEHYLEIVRPYNEALEKLEQAVNGGESLETQTALAEDTAAALENEIDQLQSTAWPTEIRSSVDDLAEVSEEALEHWRQAADAQTQDDLISAVLAAAEFDGTDAATAIREYLGLDSYDEDDY